MGIRVEDIGEGIVEVISYCLKQNLRDKSKKMYDFIIISVRREFVMYSNCRDVVCMI